jgi:phosphoserine/homoserine phosphotransferase
MLITSTRTGFSGGVEASPLSLQAAQSTADASARQTSAPRARPASGRLSGGFRTFASVPDRPGAAQMHAAVWRSAKKTAHCDPGAALHVACLDLEGVLVPEIWINVAERTGIEALRITTRDEPDYDKLMKYRLGILAEHGLRLADIQKVIASMAPLPGAPEFLAWLRERTPVLILSDTFYEFAAPLMRQLGHPTLFCHRLGVDADGKVVDYHIRLPDQKRRTVESLHQLAFEVIAAGDSYNDTAMLGAADFGILFRPPDNVIREFPQFPVTRSYDELRRAFEEGERRCR